MEKSSNHCAKAICLLLAPSERSKTTSVILSPLEDTKQAHNTRQPEIRQKRNRNCTANTDCVINLLTCLAINSVSTTVKFGNCFNNSLLNSTFVLGYLLSLNLIAESFIDGFK